MNLAVGYIIAFNALTAAQGRLPSLTMTLASPFSALCSLLTLLGTVGAQNSSSLSSTSSAVSSSFSSPTGPSPTSLGPPLATSGYSKLGDVLVPTIGPYTFNPFPAPSESPIPGVFPETWPDNPPPVDDPAIPNFGPAWENAYGKAREMVSAP